MKNPKPLRRRPLAREMPRLLFGLFLGQVLGGDILTDQIFKIVGEGAVFLHRRDNGQGLDLGVNAESGQDFGFWLLFDAVTFHPASLWDFDEIVNNGMP